MLNCRTFKGCEAKGAKLNADDEMRKLRRRLQMTSTRDQMKEVFNCSRSDQCNHNALEFEKVRKRFLVILSLVFLLTFQKGGGEDISHEIKWDPNLFLIFYFEFSVIVRDIHKKAGCR